VNGNEASDEWGRGAMSGVEGHGMARFGVEVDGRRCSAYEGLRSSAEEGRVVGKGKDIGVVSIVGKVGMIEVEAGACVVVAGRASLGIDGCVRSAGWTSRSGFEACGRSVGWVNSSLKAGNGLDGVGGVLRVDVVRLTFDASVMLFGSTFGGADFDLSFVCCACIGKGGSGLSFGGGGRRATLFFDASHSGRGVPGSSESDVPGTWFFELPRSGIADVGSPSFSL
jgi:hypothetical protein